MYWVKFVGGDWSIGFGRQEGVFTLALGPGAIAFLGKS